MRAIILLPLLLVGCQTAKPLVAPPPEPRKVVVTDVAPSNAVVERSVARVEARVAETSSKVDEVTASVSGAVETAIRANDEARLVEMRVIAAQVDELRIGLKLAAAESEAMAAEVKATKDLVAKVQAERDAARVDEQKAILAHESAQAIYAVNLEAEKGRTLSETDRADRLNKWVWKLSLTLGGIVLAGVAWLAFKLLR